MVHAPNRGKDVSKFKPSSPAMLKFLGIDRELRVAVGPPDASLRLWLIEPKRVSGTSSETLQPKGTILVLHGYRASVIWLKGMGRRFAQAGYRVVMVDMRGHGRSTGDYIAYGVVESRDTRQVIDYLETQDLIAGRLGVWGISMGAATAIKTAATDPRIDAVVAVAPYTSMRSAVPHLVQLLVPVYGWMLDEEDIDRIIDAGGREASFNPDEADPLTVITSVHAPVRFIHGKCDWIIPPSQSRQLHAAAPDGCDLAELGWTGHISAHFSGTVARKSIEWFDRTLAADGRR